MSIKVGIARIRGAYGFRNMRNRLRGSRCMDEMREAGYDGVELGPWGYFPNRNPALEQELNKRSLTLVAGTVGGDFLNDTSVDEMCGTIG